jgi:hypothetical protein
MIGIECIPFVFAYGVFLHDLALFLQFFVILVPMLCSRYYMGPNMIGVLALSPRNPFQGLQNSPFSSFFP